jgi:hypothetical protein
VSGRLSLREQAKAEASTLVSNYNIMYCTFLVEEMKKALDTKILKAYGPDIQDTAQETEAKK